MSDAKKPILVVDTQIYLRAAINSRSLPARLLSEFAPRYVLATSAEIRAEVEDVLNRPKLRAKFSALTDDRVAEFMAVIDSGLQVKLGEVPAVSRDPKDDIFLATAVEAKADYLLSEDKDLLVLESHHETRIVNALELLRIFEGDDDSPGEGNP